MQRISIGLQTELKQVEVILEPHLLFSDSLCDEMQTRASHFALFCDEKVAAVIGKKWLAHLQKKGLQVSLFTFPSGEREKSRERKVQLEDLLFSQKLGGDTCLIALGGGVTTDLIGFLASTFCRGVPLINVPTTLLGMVDASIGGKTGVNTPFGKNLIGSFYPAERILIDPLLLQTLPSEEWTNGCAEVIKYALIFSPKLFKELKHWNPTDSRYLEHIIHECIQIKGQVVEKDFEEKWGLRRILNFGHTIAHALETIENYKISHGEAVAIGMLVESRISLKKGLLSEQNFAEIEDLIRSFPFRLQLSPAVTLEAMQGALILDKKSRKKTPRFVLLEAIGTYGNFAGEYCSEVSEPILKESLKWMIAVFSGDRP